jgi:Flp pilus assembly protein TadG
MPALARFTVRRARPTLRNLARLPVPARRRLPWRRRPQSDPRGQALVEFAAVLMPVLLLIVAVIQFGLLFGANVTLTNAAREASRAGTIYLYDRTHTKAWNDGERCADIVTAAQQSLGFLDPSAPHFSVTLPGGTCPTPGASGQTVGDVTISYCDHVTTPDGDCPDTTDPDTSCVPDEREGCLLRVTLTYRSDIIVPFIGGLIGADANGRFAQSAMATMVVN